MPKDFGRTKTFRLNEAVKGNGDRFPDDLLFQLGAEDWKSLTSQIAISSCSVSHQQPNPQPLVVFVTFCKDSGFLSR